MFPKKSPEPTPINSRIRIPQHYQRQPVISRLISRYGVTVNITAAMLTTTENYGWFDLQFQGNPDHICNSLLYLQKLGIDLIQLGITGMVQNNYNSHLFPNQNQEINKRELLHSPTPINNQAHQVYTGQSHRLRLQICILKDYHQTPVISNLISLYGITVNIIEASLPLNQEDDGWFDLDLWGKPQQLLSSFNHLEKLNLPLWIDASSLYGHTI
ncbi:MAG: NIL domain-containing protein [Desmonostoc vinosum HA7617-LM4]|jgi:ABC-type methionine transport system ATPase subunit|nr:NIL domain-containing protein [Desmonostoc vinosum HA7617-LM4]